MFFLGVGSEHKGSLLGHNKGDFFVWYREILGEILLSCDPDTLGRGGSRVRGDRADVEKVVWCWMEVDQGF